MELAASDLDRALASQPELLIANAQWTTMIPSHRESEPCAQLAKWRLLLCVVAIHRYHENTDWMVSLRQKLRAKLRNSIGLFPYCMVMMMMMGIFLLNFTNFRHFVDANDKHSKNKWEFRILILILRHRPNARLLLTILILIQTH